MKQSYMWYGLPVIACLALVFALIIIFAPFQAENAVVFKTIGSGSTDSGAVLIELTPEEMHDGVLNVRIAANTHSVDLTKFDLKRMAALEFSGKTLKPTEAPVLQGHHVSGTLRFDTGENIKIFTIKIRGIPNVEERVFEWN